MNKSWESLEINRISERQDLYKETISLIEKSLGYQDTHSYEVDFAPLVDTSNHENCYILHQNNEVLGHIGLLKKVFNYKDNYFNAYFIGGICISEKIRGQGHFNKFFNQVINLYKDTVPFLLLWSDLDKLYSKYDFYEFGSIYQTGSNPQIEIEPNISKINLKDYIEDIKRKYSDLSKENVIYVNRDNHDWEKIAKIESANVYAILRDNNVESYFIKDKGADLKDIIHESFFSFHDEIERFKNYTLWLPPTLSGNNNIQELYSGFLKIGNEKLFSNFVNIVSDNKISIKEINSSVKFSFNCEDYELDLKSFIQGTLGPGRLEEFKNIPDFYISGLDSI